MSQVHFYQLASWVFFANAAQSLVVFVRIRSRYFHLTLPRNMRIIGLEDTSRLRYTNPPNTKQPSASSDRKMPSLGIHIFSVQTLSCKAFRPGIKDSCRVKFADMSWERVQPTKILVCNFFVIDHFLGGRTLAQDTSATSSGFGGDLFTQPKAGYKYHPESESQVIPSKIFNSDVVKKWRGLRLSLRTSTFGKSISIVLHMRLVLLICTLFFRKFGRVQRIPKFLEKSLKTGTNWRLFLRKFPSLWLAKKPRLLEDPPKHISPHPLSPMPRFGLVRLACWHVMVGKKSTTWATFKTLSGHYIESWLVHRESW